MSDEQREYYKRWYAKNRDERNRRRRERYAEDDDYRERELDRRMDYEKRGPKADSEKGVLLRTHKGSEVQVFRMGEVAVWCSTTPDTIRKYERGGMIPSPLFSGSHRLYTDRQCELIAEVVDFFREHRWAWQHRGKEAEVDRERSALKKRVAKEWKKL